MKKFDCVEFTIGEEGKELSLSKCILKRHEKLMEYEKELIENNMNRFNPNSDPFKQKESELSALIASNNITLIKVIDGLIQKTDEKIKYSEDPEEIYKEVYYKWINPNLYLDEYLETNNYEYKVNVALLRYINMKEDLPFKTNKEEKEWRTEIVSRFKTPILKFIEDE